MIKKLIIASIVTLGAIVWIGLAMHAGKIRETNQSPLGLTLVATYKPLNLYIYADINSTNRLPSYLVCEGNDDLVYRANTESNTFEITHFEYGHQVLLTRRDKGGTILRRITSFDDDSSNVHYTYMDKNGDGLWDVFLDHGRNMFYVRSNLCWILKSHDGNQ